ncbi:sodium:proton antiporter [Aquabacterium lacunae]|uniref:Sodium:proton antiporter n=1 Tax=Aquabacterium lacunae TaxID=2528630 RepID=A0A4Q9GXM1_9BURK|nr:cation:proton antiporter [Aquabacterium lacunae]TBO30092.1 sodium:proton antiporter [Aquabacterium lacunae]
MPHDVSLISTLSAAFALALLLGFAATRLRLPPLVGYLLAGVMIGPATPGFVADVKLSGQLAEIGVMLLMFGVGLHFSVADLMAVRRIAVPGAIVQIAVATALGMVAAHTWEWSLGASVVLGLSLSVASTVVLLKALEARGAVETGNGRIAVGWLVVEDLVMVLVLVLLPVFSGLLLHTDGSAGTSATDPWWVPVVSTLAKVFAFIATMLIVGKRLLPKVLWWVARSGSRELFTLSVVAIAVGVAFGAAKLFDVSFALGAFFAGMMMQESEFSHRAAEESLPLRDAFSVLFFVSVGMLFDPAVLWQAPGKLAVAVAIVMLGKTLAAMALVLLMRYPLNTALTVGVSLAQIGEFSFILASLGVGLGLLHPEGQNLILATALVSIAANSALFAAIGPVLNWARQHSALARRLEARDDPLAELPSSVDQKHLHGQVVIVGHDRLGQDITEQLLAQHLSVVVADERREVVEALRERQIPAVTGDLNDPATLIQAHIARASLLVITRHDTLLTRHLVGIARELNPGIQVVVHAANAEEAQLLQDSLNITACWPDQVMASGLSQQVLARIQRAP